MSVNDFSDVLLTLLKDEFIATITTNKNQVNLKFLNNKNITLTICN